MKSVVKCVILAVLVSMGYAFAFEKAPLYLFFPNTLTDWCISYGNCCNAKTDSGFFTEISPSVETEVALVSDAQKEYLDMPHDQRIAYFANPDGRKKMQKAGFYPKTVTLKWKCASTDMKKLRVAVSENADMNPSVVVSLPTDATQLELNNLKIAANYYWCVMAGEPGNCHKSPVYSFTTEAYAPRFLKIQGLWNTRDLGGRIGLDGRRMKQGLVYRTGGLNNNATNVTYNLETLEQENPAIYAKKLKLDSEKENLKKRIAENETIDYIPLSIKNAWTVYLPEKQLTEEQRSEFLALTTVPDEVFGVKGVEMQADEKNRISFSGPEDYRPSLFIQQFESEKDGIAQLGCGGDWFWTLSVNGEVIIDRWQAGNGGNPISVDNYVTEITVRKGLNTIAVALGSGSAGWCWCAGVPERTVSHCDVLNVKLGIVRSDLKDILIDKTRMVPGKKLLNDSMRRYMTDFLEIRSDIDLRSHNECYGMTGSPLGSKTYWFHYSSGAYGGMDSDFGREAFRKVFSVFLNPNNYPIDFHCIAGQDRTGAVAFIVNALLGIPEDELYLDWETTGFWNGDINFNHEKRFNALVHAFDGQPGDTIHQRVENYVLELGFTKDDIKFLRDFLLE